MCSLQAYVGRVPVAGSLDGMTSSSASKWENLEQVPGLLRWLLSCKSSLGSPSCFWARRWQQSGASIHEPGGRLPDLLRNFSTIAVRYVWHSFGGCFPGRLWAVLLRRIPRSGWLWWLWPCVSPSAQTRVILEPGSGYHVGILMTSSSASCQLNWKN